ncbi:MAG: ArsR/SmtB family transcription factor [Pyrinomonadaceae bacterium]
MNESDFRELERLFLALGDKTRLRLLALMADGEVPVNFLAERLGESQPKVSRHLAYLRNAGVVNTRRDGKWIYYGISYPEDESTRRVLETVVQSIAVIRGDGEYVYFTATEDYTKELLSPQNNIYVKTDIKNKQAQSEINIYELDVYDLSEPEEREQETEEMDVFLL